MNKFTTLLVTLLFVSGCAPHYSLVAPGTVSAKGITLNLTRPWNKSPFSPGPNVELWTGDGEALNQVFVIGAVEDGETLFKAHSKELAMPTFSADMLPNELVDLAVTSLKLHYGSELAITSSNLRPQQVSGAIGFRFNVAHYTQAGLSRQGDVLAAVRDKRLYMVIYMAAKTHYYDRQISEIEQLFESAQISTANGSKT